MQVESSICFKIVFSAFNVIISAPQIDGSEVVGAGRSYQERYKVSLLSRRFIRHSLVLGLRYKFYDWNDWSETDGMLCRTSNDCKWIDADFYCLEQLVNHDTINVSQFGCWMKTYKWLQIDFFPATLVWWRRQLTQHWRSMHLSSQHLFGWRHLG